MGANVIDNAGVGKVEMTFENLTTTVTAGRPITQADLDAGRDAVALLGNKIVGIATTIKACFGKALAVGNELTSKGKPKRVVVQTGGCMLLNGTTTLPTIVSTIATKGGKVEAVAGTTAKAFNVFRQPTVIEVWDTDKVNVIF